MKFLLANTNPIIVGKSEEPYEEIVEDISFLFSDDWWDEFTKELVSFDDDDHSFVLNILQCKYDR